jgi:DNA-binding GntR family transcriptional regulator
MASEAALQQEYGLARKTVRRAIGVLVDEGLALVVPQRGTFVKPAKKAPRNDVTVAEPQ